MEKQGLVSVWVGVAESDAALDEYMMFHYTEEGEAKPCPFGEAFGIEWFNEDFRESAVVEPPSASIGDLLAAFPRGSMIAPRLAERFGETLGGKANAVILLYNYEYDGRVPKHINGGVRLKYLGAVPYE